MQEARSLVDDFFGKGDVLLHQCIASLPEGIPHDLIHAGVDVDRLENVIKGAFHSHDWDDLMYQLAGINTDHMESENAPCLLVNKYFCEAMLGPKGHSVGRVCVAGKTLNVGNCLLLEILLVLSNSTDFRMGEDSMWNGRVMDGCVLGLFREGDMGEEVISLKVSGVTEHIVANAITERPHSRACCLQMIIHLNMNQGMIYFTLTALWHV